MAIQAVPAYLQNASHSAALFRQAMSNPYISAGVIVPGEFAVGAQSTPNMSVLVGAGRAKVAGSQISPPTLLSGVTASFTTQAMYDVLNDASVTLTVATADPTNPRIDTVYVAVQDSYYSGSNNQAVLGVVTGTPAPSPVATAAPSNSLVLAYVAVAANATSVVTGNISGSPALAVASTAPTLLGSARLATGANPTLVASPSWTTLVSVTATSVGGLCEASWNAVHFNGSSGANRSDNFRVTCDGTQIDDTLTYDVLLTGGTNGVPAGFIHRSTPGAGSHTWALQANASAATSVQVRNAVLTIVGS